MTTPLRILLAGGGTGGHVYPSLSVAAQANGSGGQAAEFLYVGGTGGLERGIVEKTGMPFEAVAAGAVRGRSPIAGALGLSRSLQGVAQARRIIRRFRPSAVLATGGFVCVPVVLAARLSGVPTVVYLPDLRPGWAVRFLSRIATAVAVSFEEVRPHIPSRNVHVTGYPVRPELMRWTRPDARDNLGIPDDASVVLVMGGSRGALTINNAIADEAAPLLERAWVIHATGTKTYSAIESKRQMLPESLRERYRLSPYLDQDLGPALAASSLVIARAGASALGEFPAVGVPGLVVPYPYAGAHQQLNADFLASRGAAESVDDAAAARGTLVTSALVLLADPQRLERMGHAMRGLARPDAAGRLLSLVADCAHQVVVGRLA